MTVNGEEHAGLPRSGSKQSLDSVTSDGSSVRSRRRSGGGLTSQRSTLFQNPDDMKKAVKDLLLKPQYNVADYYFQTGLYRKIATNFYFEHLTLAVISINAVWLSIDTDLNVGSTILFDADPIFQIAEQLFCIYFTFEWYVRFMSFEKKRNCLRDAWFVFDSALVGMMVFETWLLNTVFLFIDTGGGGSPLGNASMLRMLRLLRLSRMARMLRSMPELMILIKGMVAASRSVFFTMCLLVLVLYIFAIIMRQLSDGTKAGYFYYNSILGSMYSLLIHGTFLDNLGPVAETTLESSLVCFIIFYVFVCLAALMVMNMLIGVLCEVVSAVAETEREEMTVGFVKDKMETIVNAIDEDGDCSISKEEFGKLLDCPDAVVCMNDVGVDPIGLVDFADFIFDGEDGVGRELSFEQFMDIVLQLRGTNSATVKDVMTLQKVTRSEVARLEEVLVAEIQQRERLASSKAASKHSSSTSGSGSPGCSGRDVSLDRSLDRSPPSAHSVKSSARSIQDVRPRTPSASVQKLVTGNRLDGLISAARDELQRLRPTSPNPGVVVSEEDKVVHLWADQMERALMNGLRDLQSLRHPARDSARNSLSSIATATRGGSKTSVASKAISLA